MGCSPASPDKETVLSAEVEGLHVKGKKTSLVSRGVAGYQESAQIQNAAGSIVLVPQSLHTSLSDRDWGAHGFVSWLTVFYFPYC
jgi:hypothetical protein